jgi:hypothetical protein
VNDDLAAIRIKDNNLMENDLYDGGMSCGIASTVSAAADARLNYWGQQGITPNTLCEMTLPGIIITLPEWQQTRQRNTSTALGPRNR